MKEIMKVRSFGPIRELDITFEKITIFIGDQGTGKSCIAKLFSMFKWMEKSMLRGQYDVKYFSLYSRFEKQLEYHRIDSFLDENKSYISFDTKYYSFLYENGAFSVTEKTDESLKGLAKVMYVPAERCYLSSAEKGVRKSLGLPQSCVTFNDRFNNAKVEFKSGFDLPFGGLRFEYMPVNETSYISTPDYKIKLSDSSSGIQSVLPLCLVTEYLSAKVSSEEEREMTSEEQERVRKEVKAIMDSKDYSEIVKEEKLKRVSAISRYSSFINIVEEPELNMFPNTQLSVIRSLVKVNNQKDDNMLIITTHSPYMLAIANTLTMASKISVMGEEWATQVNDIEPNEFHIEVGKLAVYGLNLNKEEQYCRSIVDANTNMISINDLDCASEIISSEFNKLYRLHGKAIRNTK